MQISTLNLENVRCIKKADIYLGENVNLLLGNNGSGKSTLLESIYILATGKSFRTSKLDSVKNFEGDNFTIFSKIEKKGFEKTVGFRKVRTKVDIRIDSIQINKLSELALNFSLLTFHSNSICIIEGEPQYRRRYIDWWLFHSKPQFYQEWLRYQKLLKQRNAALRQDNSLLHVWDEAFAESGDIIDALRKSAIQELMEEILNIIKNNNLTQFNSLSWQYNSGWAKDETLLSSLKRSHKRDVLYGFTSVGIHRSDLRFYFHGKDAKEFLSRGQQKTLSLIMLIALASIHKKILHETPIFIIDDISSELDATHRYNLTEQIVKLGGQIILTAIDEKDLRFPMATPVSSFVLKQGEVHVL